jgi:hypothetical protein
MAQPYVQTGDLRTTKFEFVINLKDYKPGRRVRYQNDHGINHHLS